MFSAIIPADDPVVSPRNIYPVKRRRSPTGRERVYFIHVACLYDSECLNTAIRWMMDKRKKVDLNRNEVIENMIHKE